MNIDKYIHDYYKSVCDAYRLGNIETAYNKPITILLEHFACTALDLSGGRAGKSGENIDIKLWYKEDNPSESEPFAGVEVKKINGIDERAKNQIITSSKRFGNVILTDNLSWQFWHNSEDKPYAKVQLITLKSDKLVLNTQNIAKYISLVNDFMLNPKVQIRSSNKLAEYMARHASSIRDIILEILKDDGTGNPLVDESQMKHLMFQELYGLYRKIDEELRPLLDVHSFADMYAQTIVYGLFIARYNDVKSTTFDRFKAIGKLQEESVLLSKFFTHIASAGKMNQMLDSVIDKLCVLFQTCDISALLNLDEKRDTIVHFYEDFLSFYDPDLRKKFGVYLTPPEVVRYLISSVDKILIEDFSIPDGLSNNELIPFAVKTEQSQMSGEVKNHIDTKLISVPRVAVLDPACGTGTFLAKIIKYIRGKYFSGSFNAFYDDYLKEENGLLSRLVGFEIMMTSYVVAHLNVRRAIEETLASMPDKQLHTNIYLTNTLAPPNSNLERNAHLKMVDFSQAIIDEAYEADTWKARRPIKVIIGNPPFDVASTTEYDISAYRTETDGKSKLEETNSKVLGDYYVKFFRFAQEIIEQYGEGVLAFVSPHGIINNKVFRGLRASLLRTFDKVYIVNLHGNINRGEVAPDGSIDENVFSGVMQGIALFIGVKTTDKTEWATVKYADLWGTREDKFQKLLNGDLSFSNITPDNKMAYLMKLGANRETYDNNICLNELFPAYVSGVKSGNDLVAIAPTREELNRRLELVRNATNDGQILDLFGKLQSGQTADKIKNDILSSDGKMVQISFRPFDTRWTYYSGISNGWCERPRPKKIMGQLSLEQETPDGRNIGFVFTRGDTSPNDFSMIFVSETIIDNRFTPAQTAGNAFIAPLYLYDEAKRSWKQNFSHMSLAKLTAHMSFQPTPIQIFDYIYGVLNDPSYRNHFNDFLKLDYPRIPIINNPLDKDNPDAFYVSEKHFHIYVDAGLRLRKLHLQYDKVLAPITLEPNNAADLVINKTIYKNNLLHINKNTSIHGIPGDVWNFRIAGRQVLDEWFKSHKGEVMTIKDFKHISSIVGLVTETIKIQKELIEFQHGIE